VAAAFRISALGAPYLKEPPAPVRSLLRVCIPRRRDQTNQLLATKESHKRKAMTPRICTQALQFPVVG
jgi:hypothetical protein